MCSWKFAVDYLDFWTTTKRRENGEVKKRSVHVVGERLFLDAQGEVIGPRRYKIVVT